MTHDNHDNKEKSMTKKYDLVLWGATGFTGQIVAAYLARHYGTELRWAIAGRNAHKLDGVRRTLGNIHPEFASLPLLVGDSQDRASLDEIVRQTRVIISAVGPYALYGTPLVAACAAHGVDYCDITGEVPWIRQNIVDFQAQARETGARIVHCCGFDSIPSDLGVLLLQDAARERYGRSCQAIQYYLLGLRGGFSGGTVASLLNLLEKARSDRDLRRVLADPYTLVPRHPGPRQEDQTSARWDADIQSWTAPFIMATINTRIVHRSNYLLGYRYGEQFRYGECMRMGAGLVNGRLSAHAFSTGFKLFTRLATVGVARRILEKTVLPAPGEGPSEETRNNGYFKVLLLGKTSNRQGQPTTLRAEIGGQGDPGYNETAKMLAESAVCLALDKEIPQQGGILTPAAAMGQRLIGRLRAAGMTFSVEG